jgi:CDP-6-deoxy-D-xylo-4-hexulose-3-dehydrase
MNQRMLILENFISDMKKYYKQDEVFERDKTFIQYAGNVFDEREVIAAVEVLLQGWLGLAERGLKLENKLNLLLGTSAGALVNSGSSANLLAIACLKSQNHKGISVKDGDEIIVPASSFPTTVNPILQNNLIPVFVDVNIGDYNIKIEDLEKALSPKTKAVMFAHTLGNPSNMNKIVEFCNSNKLALIEDCCDALGAKYSGKSVGSFGDFATLSMYPAHHITMGEGGFVGAKSISDGRILHSLRDWGRDCWCAGDSSKNFNGCCNNRFSKWLEGIDDYIDHKYVYGEVGYNLKPTEIQAAIGLAQIDKLEDFIKCRNLNFTKLYNHLKRYEEYLILPTWSKKAEPSWFAFPLTVKNTAPFKKDNFVKYLEQHRIQTRPLFAGNLLKHPAYKNVPHRQIGNLENSNYIIQNSFFTGVYPGITEEKMNYVLDIMDSFFEKYKS